ncbi:DHA2 family efflux MFS transporter permease subunit [Streptomyces pacificus]|uniref:DHA2 family efflux MFS transporter permease subunit n=1 Tax=Streptomyces pacificus TaxID=2705029 RepID=UPI0020B1330A|nr:DHA2 family efflux MFS transporter permease subunit [Streptomyces pacificus]
MAITGNFLALLDTTIVNVSLHDTAAHLGSISRVQWAVTTYLLALAALMPATGWLVTRFGVKRVFTGAASLFLLGSAACALSSTLPELTAARALSGAAAGVLVPASTILLTRGVPREQLGRVQGLNGSVMLISPLLGPTIGGLLVQAGGWRAVYAVNIPLCAALVLVTLRRVRPDPPHSRQARPLDVVGLLSSATFTVCTVLAVRAFSGLGWTASADLLVPLLLAVLSGAVFVIRELRAAFPLLDVRLFGHHVYRTAAINIFCLGFVLYSPMMLIPLYFQSARGESPVTTGLLMSAGGIGVVAASWLCRVLMKRVGGGATVVIGVGLTMLATVPLTGLSATTPYPLLCVSLAVRGLGTGLTIVPAMTRAYQSIRAESIPDASAQLNLIQRIGGSVALAVVTVLLDRAAHRYHGLTPDAFASSFGWLLVIYGFTLVPALALLVADRREARHAPG